MRRPMLIHISATVRLHDGVTEFRLLPFGWMPFRCLGFEPGCLLEDFKDPPKPASSRGEIPNSRGEIPTPRGETPGGNPNLPGGNPNLPGGNSNLPGGNPGGKP